MSFLKPKRRVSEVFIHCSASDRPEHDSVKVMREWHLQRGWSDVGYHYFIRKDGIVETGRHIERVPAAQEGNNSGTIAVCLHGLEEDRFTEAQFRSLRSLAMQIDAAYNHAVTFHGHCEVSTKLCPVFDYKRVLDLDSAGRIGPGIRRPEGLQPVSPAEAAKKNEVANPGQRTLAMSMRGSDVRYLQAKLGLSPVDGVFGRMTYSAVRQFQEDVGLTVDGVVGPSTWAALDAEIT